jgi:hypothetical protein
MIKVWLEDDVTVYDPDHEGIYEAYKRIVGESLDLKQAVRRKDLGDSIRYFMPNGYVVTMSYPGNDSIHKEDSDGS